MYRNTNEWIDELIQYFEHVFDLGLEFVDLSHPVSKGYVSVIIDPISEVSRETSAQIGAWKCNFPPFQEIMTYRPTNHPTDMTDGDEGS